MGKALHWQHINFFTTRMDEHNLVKNWHPIEHQDEYLFNVTRTLNRVQSDVLVHLSDAYRYGMAEFFARPKQLKPGSFVVIAMPHASVDDAVIEKAKGYGIGIGFIGKFMGALNYQNIWEYMTPDEKKRHEG